PFSSVHECRFSTNYSCPPSRSRRRPLEKDTGSDPEDWHRVLFSWHMGSTANMQASTTTDQTDVTDTIWSFVICNSSFSKHPRHPQPARRGVVGYPWFSWLPC